MQIARRRGIRAKYGWIAVGLLLLSRCVNAAVTPTGTVFTEGGDPADDGPVTPTSGDLIVPNSDLVIIGDVSQLVVDGTSLLQAGGIATDDLTSSSIFTVTGAGSSINLLGTGNRLILNGTSSASILDGAIFTANDATGCTFGTCNIVVAGKSGSNALLTVAGAGSRLDATSAIVVGTANVDGTTVADAVGRLVIESGGVVNGDRSSFAQGSVNNAAAISRGFLEVRGAGSQFNVNEIILGNNFSQFDNGVATVTIEDQGAVNVQGAIVAGLGVNTDATITVQNAGTLNALALYGSRGVGSVSALTIDGAGTTANFGDELVIGQGSTGTLAITDGAAVTIGGGTETGFIGSSLTLGVQGGTGAGVIDNASLVIGPNVDLPEVRLSIGLQGSGDLVIQNGATVRVEDLTGGLGQVGDGVTVGESGAGQVANGSLVIQGAGTSLAIETIDLGALIVGVSQDGVLASTGVVDILDGAAVSVSGTGFNSGINVGRGGNANGTLNVSGAGSTLDVVGPAGVIAIASNFGGEPGDAQGSMTVTDGAQVNLAGLTPGQGFFSVGNGAGSGTLLVNTGGTVNIDGSLSISVVNQNGNTQNGQVTVSDSGVINVGQIQVGNRGLLTGDGTVNADLLTVFTGGSVDLDSLDGIAALSVNGGAYSASQADFTLGLAGGQSFSIVNGGQLNTPDVTRIGGAGLTGSATVDGAGSLFDVGGDLFINDSVTLNNGGRLQSAGNVVIANGGRLGGDGGTLTALSTQILTGGTLAPGNSPGVLNIVGDVLLDGGTFEFEIAGATAGQFDVLNVDGNLDLQNGTVSVALLDDFRPGGQSFDIFTATGTLNVEPGVSFINNGPGPDFEFSTRSAGGIDFGTITFTARDVASIGTLTTKQLNMARYLDDLCPRIEGLSSTNTADLDLDLRCGNLRSGSTTDAQVATAMEQLTPDEVLGTFNSLIRFAPLQHGTLSRRLNGLRSGASRIDLSNLELVTDNASVSGEDLQNVIEELGQDRFGRWGFFSEGRVQFGDRDETRATPGYDFETVALTVGTDYKLRDNMYLGVALGYNDVDADFDVGGGVALRSYSLSLLGTYFQGDTFYVDSLLTYAHTDVETDRRIRYSDAGGSVSRKASGDTDGDQFALGLGSGFDFTRGRWVWGPHAGLNYSDTHIDGFNEVGASGLNLAMPDTATRSLTTNAGIHTSFTITPSWGVVVPYAQLDYVHEFQADSGNEKVRFVQDVFGRDALNPTGPVSVANGSTDSNYFTWSVGVHLQMAKGIAGFVDYRGTAGLKDLDLNELAVGIRFERRLP